MHYSAVGSSVLRFPSGGPVRACGTRPQEGGRPYAKENAATPERPGVAGGGSRQPSVYHGSALCACRADPACASKLGALGDGYSPLPEGGGVTVRMLVIPPSVKLYLRASVYAGDGNLQS